MLQVHVLLARYKGLISSFLPVVILTCLLVENSNAHVPEDFSIGAPDPFNEWKTLETDNFRINFQKEHQAYAQKMAATAEEVHTKTTDWLEWVPRDKTEIIINDSFDGSNGGAITLPYNRFFIFMNTPSDGELQDNGAWLELVFTHEYIHILHLDQVSRFPSVLRKIFGRLFFTFPQIFNPKWVTEGLAVYGETEKSKGFGRGQGSIYHAMMREEVANGLRSLPELSYQGYRGTDWPSGQVYLYGYYFFEFLESQYSKADVIRYIKNWNKNIVPWRLSSRAHQVFGITGKTLWENYQQYLEKKFRPELVAQSSARSNNSSVSHDKRTQINPRLADNGDLYFYQSTGKTHPSIERIDIDNKQHLVAKVQGFNQFDWHNSQGILLSRGEICNNVNVFADLYRWNSQQEKWNRLTHCGRYPRAAWRSDGNYIVAVHVEKGLTNLDILDGRGEVKMRLPALPDGDSIGDVDWYVADSVSARNADEGRIVAAVKRKATGWNIEQLDLKTNTWTKITSNNDVESKPRYSEDGSVVYFISDHNRKINVRKVALATGTVSTLSDSTSYIKDFSIHLEQGVFTEYGATGFTLSRMNKLATVGNDYQAHTEQKNVETFELSKGYHPEKFLDITRYTPWRSLRPRAWWAMLIADGEDNTSIQTIVDGSDALGFHRWQLAPQIFIDKREFGGDASYNFYNRLALLASRKVEIEQESDSEKNEPEIREISERFQAVLMLPRNSLENSFRLHVGAAQEYIDQRIEGFGHRKLKDNLLGVSLQFLNIEHYVHSISPEDGRRVRIIHEQYDAFGSGDFSGPATTLDWREYISLYNNHVVSLRWVQGLGSKSAKPYELGGNIDQISSLAGNVGFGLTDYSLRGYAGSDAELTGRSMTLLSAEWRMPLIEVFYGWMAPPVGLGKTSMSIFVDTGKAGEVGENHRYYTGVGVEFKPQILLGLDNFVLDTRIGFAHGLDHDLGETNVYLTLGTSF